MTSDNEIINEIKRGASYNYIADKFHVSKRRISQLKKLIDGTSTSIIGTTVPKLKQNSYIRVDSQHFFSLRFYAWLASKLGIPNASKMNLTTCLGTLADKFQILYEQRKNASK